MRREERVVDRDIIADAVGRKEEDGYVGICTVQFRNRNPDIVSVTP